MIDSLTSLGNKISQKIPSLKNIDQTAQRNYLEEGYLSNNFDGTSAKLSQILIQQPQATVIFRKKMYTSIANNYITKSMSAEERLYLSAMDRLFFNKCKQIQAYEALCKIEKASDKVGEIDEQILPIIIGLSDTLSSTMSVFGKESNPLGSFGDVTRQLKSVLNNSSPNFYTTWIEDLITPAPFRFGTGTGAIEFSNFTSFSTNCTIKGSGNFSVTFDDPYELMTITPQNIEVAISDVVSGNSLNLVDLGSGTYQSLIDSNMQKLSSIRESRGASKIQFNINPNTIRGRKVIAIVEATGQEIPFEEPIITAILIDGINSVKVAKEYLYGGEVLGEQGLAEEPIRTFFGTQSKKSILAATELSIFKDLVNAIYNKINFDKNSISPFDFARSTKEINDVRKKLSFYFAGKNIIQPMDTVNIFISSKSKYDSKIMSGMKNAFEGFGLFNNFSNQLTQLSSSWNALFSPSNIENQIEKTIFGAENLPDYIWNMFRKNYTSEKEGCHAYAGIVNRVSSGYSDGFNVTVSGTDNTEYLNQSFVNFKPGANANFGIFYEPLTPFKSSIDSVSNLRYRNKVEYLDENKENFKNFKLPAGSAAGRSFGDSEIPSEVVYTKTGTFTNGKKIIYAPDGLVYKWKEGIGTYSLSGSSDDINTEENFGIPSTMSSILANQDIMNAVSLMVTGTPYNYYNYYKAGIEAGALQNSVTSAKNTNSYPSLTASALSNFIERTSQNNALWGDFIPFKGINISKQDMIEKMSLRSSKIIEAQNNINQTYKIMDDLKIKISISSLNLNTKTADGQEAYQDQSNLIKQTQNLQGLSDKIGDQENEMLKILNDTNFSIIGNDIYEDYDFYFNNGMSYENSLSRKQVIKKSNFLTRRLSWAVRSNVDQNYFIVDDSYDKNMDLLAFEGDLAGQKQSLYSNEYIKVLDKVRAATDLLGMEFFADTQGNLRVRAPQYNRIPSSVFLTMIKNKYTKKAGYVFPEFLTNLLFNQISDLYDKIFIIENKIRYLLTLSLENSDDTSIVAYLKSSSAPISTTKKEFTFLTSEGGTVMTSIGEILNSRDDEDEEKRRESFSKLKEIVSGADKKTSVLKEQLNIGNTFDLATRAARIKKDIDKILKDQKIDSDQYKTFIEKKKDRLDYLSKEIYKKSGELIKVDDWVAYPATGKSTGNSTGNIFGNVLFPAIYKPDQFKIDQEVSSLLSNRQKSVKQLYYAIKNSYEFNSLNDDETAIKLLNPALAGPNEELPEIFDHLIEDESYDDYGPGSGSRYIIKNAQIISYNISENAPEFTAVSVTGRLGKNFPNNQNDAGFQDLPSNGNLMVTSSAIDYDLWRMYGLKQSFQIDKPFLTQAGTQTEPFAVSLLMNQRKNIIRGDITISGNEYMQPGEVVYIEQKGMLFYVENVSHRFSIGSSFTTTLSLSYGHYPGDYIPTQLDVAGKILYTNRDKYDVEVRRELPTSSGESAGVLVMLKEGNPTSNFTDADDFARQNCTAIQSIANKLYSEVTKESSSGKKTILNLFVYKDSSSSSENKTENFAKEILNILLGKSTYKVIDPRLVNRFTENNFKYKTDDGQIKSTIRIIDISDKKERHNPSSAAFFTAGSLIDSKSSVVPSDNIKNILSETAKGKSIAKNIYLTRYIVDCFVKSYFE